MDIERKVIDNDITKEDIINETEDNTEDIVENEEQNELEIWENKYKYLLADLMNTKKRYQKLLNDSQKYKEENLGKDLLDIVDDFERIISNIDDEGIHIIYNKFKNVLSKYEISPIYDDNDKKIFFDQKYDEAVGSNEVNDETLDNTIAHIVQKGYFYKDKILRYEKVIVNKFTNK